MTATPFRYTPEQQELLEKNDRFIPAAVFDDGDVLIFEDAGPMGGPYEGSHIAKYLPWILCCGGEVQGLSWHYQDHHDLDIPLAERYPPEPGPDLEAPERKLLTLGKAQSYLADTYDIRVSTRTLRYWCKSGRIDCQRFSDKSGAPWHTNRRSLDHVADGWIDVVDVPGAEDDTNPEGEDADGLQ